MLNSFAFDLVVSFSIILPAIAGLIKLNQVRWNYFPFILLIWIGLFNEIISTIFIFSTHSNTINSNIYVLIEYALLLFQFYKWNGIELKKCCYLILLGIVVWLIDNVILNSVWTNNSIFRIFYSFAVILLSINQISKVIINERMSLLKNAIFLICIAFLTYYGCKAFIEIFNAFHLGFSNAFNRNIFMILYFANLFSNVIYAYAILCIPTKQEFSLLY